MQKYTIYDDPVPKLPEETCPYVEQRGAEMYLAADVDAHIAELLEQHASALKAQVERIADLEFEVRDAYDRGHLEGSREAGND